ncbi:hypothetical protein K1719_012283 [Acacia pycnantha]|nr:hypothetical protein K1719_012283 [Acacia pycnantha]
MLDEVDSFVKQYRFESEQLKNQRSDEVKVCLISTRQHDGRTYNVPTDSKVAALSVGDIDMYFNDFQTEVAITMKVMKEKKTFGTIRVEVYTIEFQKRGLPHAHILLFLEKADKILTFEAIDKEITAEIPDKEKSPLLHFPKKFNENTTVDDEGYPTYRRRDDGKLIEVKGIPLENCFVVPYNPLVLAMFQAHKNVENCNKTTAIKYLFKYISKGNDRVVAGIFDNNGNGNGEAIVDKIQQYIIALDTYFLVKLHGEYLGLRYTTNFLQWNDYASTILLRFQSYWTTREYVNHNSCLR